MTASEIEKELFENQDIEYRAFQAKLMPNVDIDKIIGVRTPVLRKLAKKYAKDAEIDQFLSDLPHKYYDENNLHGFIISEEKDYDRAVSYVDAILPYVDNWATCDQLRPKAFDKHRDMLKADIRRWLSSDKTYTLRFGIEMVMTFYLDQDFDPTFLFEISKIRSDEYYVNMMIAWYFATALAKQWDETIPYIQNDSLDTWTHNKTIQKANESYRITKEQKDFLNELKR